MIANGRITTERSTRTVARRHALVGVGLFLLAWLLGGISETRALFTLMPYADIALSLGFVLALVGAILAGASLWHIVPIGVLSGIGGFYKGQDHATHVLSGWGFGLDHTPHILIGLILIGIATASAALLAFHRTRNLEAPERERSAPTEPFDNGRESV
jgi:hypothetical protein